MMVRSDTAFRLASILEMSAVFWFGLQLDWDLWYALRSEKSQEIEQLIPIS